MRHPFQAFADATTIANDLEHAVAAARNLGVKAGDMYAFVCSPDLIPAGYLGERHLPTSSVFEQTMDRLASIGTGDDSTLFFATNHGVQDGLLTSAHVDEFEPEAPRLLTPEALGQAMNRLPGAQVLIIAACYAGVFLPIGQEDRRLVLAACGHDEIYYAGGVKAWAAFPAELFRAWCGLNLDGGECPDRMDPGDAFDFAERRVMSGEVGRTIKPHRAGSVRWKK